MAAQGEGGESGCGRLEILDMAKEQAGSDDTSAAQATGLDSGHNPEISGSESGISSHPSRFSTCMYVYTHTHIYINIYCCILYIICIVSVRQVK